MNSKLLYAATVAVSLLGTLAMADDAALTRAPDFADLSAALRSGTPPRIDHHDNARAPTPTPARR